MDIYAPTYILEEFGKVNLLTILRAECENLVYDAKNKLNVCVQFSENKDFNAVAYEIGEKSYINISISVVMQIYHHVLLLMSRNELFPQLKEEKHHEETYRIEHFVSPEICSYDNKYKQIAFYSGPESPDRLRIAELIAMFGIEFVLFHELGHHLGGHLKFLNNKLGIQHLYAQGNSFTLNPQVYQMLETNADAIAGACLLENIRTKMDYYKERNLKGINELLPHCIIIGLTTAFFLMNREDATYCINNSRYIPRDIRLRFIIQIIQDKLLCEYQDCAFSQTSDNLMNTYGICNNLNFLKK